jgi:hypothetical protein
MQNSGGNRDQLTLARAPSYGRDWCAFGDTDTTLSVAYGISQNSDLLLLAINQTQGEQYGKRLANPL